jgi:Rod binding domain-containing protein
MSFDLSSSSSLTPIISSDMLSGPSGSLNAAGMSQEQKIKAVSKAMEGIFAGQLMKEMGSGLGGSDKSQEGGMYQDFIQQALAQQVTSGNGLGLAKFLETSLAPAKHALNGALTTDTSHHVQPGSH